MGCFVWFAWVGGSFFISGYGTMWARKRRPGSVFPYLSPIPLAGFCGAAIAAFNHFVLNDGSQHKDATAFIGILSAVSGFFGGLLGLHESAGVTEPPHVPQVPWKPLDDRYKKPGEPE